MNNALIGYTGFVGQTLMSQVRPNFFSSLYRSTNIDEIKGKQFDLVICAGAPAQKWIANAEPEKDEACINKLISNLKTIKCQHFVLISTVDVYKNPVNVDETTAIDATPDLHAYGRNRRLLEQFVQTHFSRNHTIVRLPGLVGKGLRKNALYDLKHNNNVDKINGANVYQFYPMINLFRDIAHSVFCQIQLINLSAEPISMSDIAHKCFGRELKPFDTAPVKYDMRSVYCMPYHYSREEVFQAINIYRTTPDE